MWVMLIILTESHVWEYIHTLNFCLSLAAIPIFLDRKDSQFEKKIQMKISTSFWGDSDVFF